MLLMHPNLSDGEGEVAFFSAKRWDRKSREDVIESVTPCRDAQKGGALPGIELCPPDCSGCKVRGLHHCATTPSPVRGQIFAGVPMIEKIVKFPPGSSSF